MALNSVVKLKNTGGSVVRAREINKGLSMCFNLFVWLTKSLLQ